MAIAVLHTFPQFAQFSLTSQLGPTKLRLRMTYRERLQSWYLDVYTLDGLPLLLGRRLSPLWSPMFGAVALMETIGGFLLTKGVENYRQDDLGRTLFLWYVSFADLQILAGNEPDPLKPTITIL